MVFEASTAGVDQEHSCSDMVEALLEVKDPVALHDQNRMRHFLCRGHRAETLTKFLPLESLFRINRVVRPVIGIDIWRIVPVETQQLARSSDFP